MKKEDKKIKKVEEAVDDNLEMIDTEDDDFIDIDFEKKIEELELKNKEIFAGWQRAEADFLNYKNKETERLGELANCIREDILEGLLPVLDNFNLAEKAIPEDKKNDNNIKGLLLIKRQLDHFLNSIGIEEVVAVGSPFDPTCFEAVEEVESGVFSGMVIEEVQKGYKLNGRIVRPAKVKISK